MYQQYKAMQKEFEVVHRTVDQLRNNSMNPAVLKKELMQLEEEKLALHQTLDKAKKKIAGVVRFSLTNFSHHSVSQYTEKHRETHRVSKHTEQANG